MKRKDSMYVTIQVLLFSIYLFRVPAIDFDVSEWIRYPGLLFAIAGVPAIVWAFIDLNKNLTPFPSPKRNGELVTGGIYRYTRHPIYTGILLITSGYALYSENTLRFFVFIALLLLFVSKARYEGGLLSKKFPGYAAYKTRTCMFLPNFF